MPRTRVLPFGYNLRCGSFSWSLLFPPFKKVFQKSLPRAIRFLEPTAATTWYLISLAFSLRPWRLRGECGRRFPRDLAQRPVLGCAPLRMTVLGEIFRTSAVFFDGEHTKGTLIRRSCLFSRRSPPAGSEQHRSGLNLVPRLGTGWMLLP